MDKPIAAFTVKHEMETYLENSDPERDEYFKILRIKDGDGEAMMKDITKEIYTAL